MACENGFFRVVSVVSVCGACWLLAVQAVRAQTGASASSSEVSVSQLATSAPTPPFGPLPPKHLEYLDSILNYWEQSSAAVQRYRCKFKRWEYDCVFGPGDTYKTYSEGVIKYATPDKGLFKVEKIWEYAPPKKAGDKPTYVEADQSHREYWVCDGQSVFEHDYQKKRLIERRLPPEMRGVSIADGPLPFLFGAKADKIKQRYWIHVITPRDATGEYWLEAYPKTQEDSGSYQKVQVIIDEERFLPKAMIVFDCNYDEQRNPSRTTFVFENRESNWSILPEKLNLFHREFYKPATPLGWTKVVEDFSAPGPGPATASVPPARRR